RGIERDRLLLRCTEFDRDTARLHDLDGVEVAGRDIDLALLEQRGELTGIAGDRRDTRLQCFERLEARLDVGFRAAVHARDLDQEAGAERGVEVGDADFAFVFWLPEISPRGR